MYSSTKLVCPAGQDTDNLANNNSSSYNTKGVYRVQQARETQNHPGVDQPAKYQVYSQPQDQT
jgi:hypothetical protein